MAPIRVHSLQVLPFHEPCPFTPKNGGRRSEIGWEGDALRSRQRFKGTIHAWERMGTTHEPFDFEARMLIAD